MITYQPEKISDVIPELKSIVGLHWSEIGAFDRDNVPLDVDWDKYVAMEEVGVVKMLTVRSDGCLIGYYIAFVTFHPHYKQTLFADCDIMFLLPSYRKGFVGYKLIKKSEEYLFSLGVKINILSTKANKNLRKLTERLGYKPLDIKYYKEVT